MPDDRPSPWSMQQHGWSAPSPGYGAAPVGPTSVEHPAYPAYPGSAYPAPYAGPPIEVRVAAVPAASRGLTVVAVVLASLALLGVLLLGVVLVGFLGADGGGGGSGPLRGTIAPATGARLTGQALADEVSARIRDDGGDPAGITCPDTPKVAQDVTTVCHGSDLGADSAFVVFFEDAKGSYTLLEV